jgi:hypothetical protein
MFRRSGFIPLNVLELEAGTIKKCHSSEVCQVTMISYSFQLIEVGTFDCIPPIRLKTMLIVLLPHMDVLWERRV